jgi:hypothetical protein
METIGMFALIGASSGALIGGISGAIWSVAHKTQNGASQNSKTVELAAVPAASLPHPVTAEPAVVKPLESVPPSEARTKNTAKFVRK